jgi:serine phosphatase RsbU (regulator of sigma subunit)
VRVAHRELGRDTSRAWGILTRERADESVPKGWLGRFLHRCRIIFLGLSYKLSPVRRMLFAVCLALALIGVQVDLPSILLASVAGLVLLLALELADRIVIRDELEVARELQREILPHTPPEVPGYQFAFSYRTANTIGGDYYDFLPMPNGRLALMVGDASGHGIAAGLIMAIANTTLKMALDTEEHPLAVATMVNRALFRTGGSRAFMTLFCGFLDPTSGRLDFFSAGHPYPMLRRTDGSIVELGEGCLPLGIRDDVSPIPGTVDLEPGDLLLMYTDGIPEAVNQAGAAFGFDRLRDLLVPGGTVTEVHDRVLRELAAFGGELDPVDDRSLVVIARGTLARDTTLSASMAVDSDTEGAGGA